MFPFLLIFVLLTAEIYIFVEVSGQVGPWLTVGMIFATAFIGSAILRYQGQRMIARAREQVVKRELPVAEFAHGAVLVLAAFLLLTPGFITDSLGVFLLIPVFRRFVLSSILFAIRSRIHKSQTWGGSGTTDHSSTVIDGDFEDISDSETGGTRPAGGKRIDRD